MELRRLKGGDTEYVGTRMETTRVMSMLAGRNRSRWYGIRDRGIELLGVGYVLGLQRYGIIGVKTPNVRVGIAYKYIQHKATALYSTYWSGLRY